MKRTVREKAEEREQKLPPQFNPCTKLGCNIKFRTLHEYTTNHLIHCFVVSVGISCRGWHHCVMFYKVLFLEDSMQTGGPSPIVCFMAICLEITQADNHWMRSGTLLYQGWNSVVHRQKEEQSQQFSLLKY